MSTHESQTLRKLHSKKLKIILFYVYSCPIVYSLLVMNSDEKSDRILIIGLKYGDEECFEELFRKYYPRFRAYAYRLIHDRHTAEDILQNVFMKLWMNRLTLDENVSVVAYLFVLARNEILNHLRYQRLHPQASADAPVREGSVNNEFDFNYLYGMVQDIVKKLPQRRREIFMMNRFEHLPPSEIARRLGISVRTVEKQIELALKTLRDSIGPILVVVLCFMSPELFN